MKLRIEELAEVTYVVPEGKSILDARWRLT